MNTVLSPERLLHLLAALANGQSMTVGELAAVADLTEADVERHFEQLVDHGVRRRRDGRVRVPGGIEFLDAARIEAGLLAIETSSLRVDVRQVTESTNDDARQRLLDDMRPPFAILAEAQRAGRGRRGRQWSSPVASNLYLTMAEALPGGPESSRGLSLAVGVAVAEGIDRVTGLDVELKWPNDLLHGGRKLGGILVELAETPAGTVALIGVGLNVQVPAYVARGIDQAWTDLVTAVGGGLSRNELAASVLSSIARTLVHFRANGFDALLRSRWQARDPFFDRLIIATSERQTLEGTERGIDDDGQLLIATDQGLQRLGAGEVSIRLAHVA